MLRVRAGSSPRLDSSAGENLATGAGVCTSACTVGCGIATCPMWQTWQCCSSKAFSCEWPTACAPNTQTATIRTTASRRIASFLGIANLPEHQ
jgi:hypothetical protein